MIIAHLPAGYVTSKLLHARLNAREAAFKPFLYAGLLGAIAPDLDKVYLYLAHDRRLHHHTLWLHFPIVWAVLLLVSLIWFHAARARIAAALAVIFSVNGLLHMVLDTVAGDIWWLAPFVDQPFSLFAVPGRYSPWWVNNMLHWTFAFELAIVAWAVHLWRRSPVPTGGAEEPGMHGDT